RPPPTSTLFPYTTLFRSRAARTALDRRGVEHERLAGRPLDGGEPGQLRQPRHPLHCYSTPDTTRSEGGGDVPGSRARRSRASGSDRKSTRLNSSHVSISY